jgi:hypothetical protein
MRHLLLVAGAVLGAAVTAHAAGTVDASNSFIQCNTFTKASIKLIPALVNGGTALTTVKIKGALSGCVTNAGVTSISGTVSGVLTGGTNDCINLIGTIPSTGTLTVKWKSTPGLINPVSTVTVNFGSSEGGFFGFGPADYGRFDLGNPPGAALAVSGSFTGGDGGATSTASVLTSQDINAILAGCGGAGVKALDIGIGTITLQ